MRKSGTLWLAKPLNFHETKFIGILQMINPNTPSIQAGAVNAANSVGSVARNTFKSILSELNTRPLKPLAMQRFAGLTSPRSLAQQVHSDTAGVV